MTTPFSAGPHALGYYHQLRYGLLALLRATDDDAQVAIEALDDVTVETGDHLALDQLKHHVQPTASLTDTSADLWKPIRVWAETFGTWDPSQTSLHLITTATAPEGSAAALLRARETGDRNVDAARTQLLAAANASTNQTLAPAFEAFGDLSGADQRRLLEALVVIDGAPNILETGALIEKALAISVRRQFAPAVRERLEGWWFERAADHIMNESRDPISRADLLDHLHAVLDTVGRDVLPLDFEHAEPEEEPDPEGDSRLFVQQLRAISLGASAIRFAILDYYRAFEQRSRWARQHLLTPDNELEIYERRLVEEWERYVARWEDDRGTSDDDHVRFGRRIYRWVDGEADIPIRTDLSSAHKYVMRGSFHMLADLLPPKVYWHPGFLDRLDSLLSEPSQPSRRETAP